ncbi:MAG TPA: MBL fold metallo-hydrolase [Planctomycetota bacterium]|nr:MBL fold metallo-hydrolase [Planctomycetota bacterium]
MMNARIKFCGGTRTVTGSMHLVKTEQSRILIDAGLFQGRRKDFYEINNFFPFTPERINAMVLSHAHIDHSGNIPNLVKHGLKAPIHATSATVDLCNLMLTDSGHIQEEDVKFVNKIRLRKGIPPVKALYTKEDANKSLEYFHGAYYEEPIKITPDISCVFYESGHVLGSAIPVLEMNGIRLAYAVDLGRKNLPLLRNPVVPKNIDYLIVESTYGNRLHDPIATAKNKLADVINKTIKRGGKVIIPSFAFERTQEVVYLLSEMFNKGVIPTVPIYVDSPLATNITLAFQQNIRYLDEETQDLMRRQQDPFGFSRIKYIRSTDESKRLNADKQPMIIISASGMCEAGRILHHLKNNIENPNNTIMIIGYMAENTLGKKIVDRQPIVKIFGEDYHLKAEVVKINSFSAHADKNELIDFIKQCAPKKKIFIVHGDMNQAEPFTEQLISMGLPAYLPTKNEEVELS